MSILVADDSRVMRAIVMRTLRQAGYGKYTVKEASDGEQAHREVLAAPFHLVLADWNMPGMSGLELLCALRAAGSTVPFGLVTAAGSSDIREQAQASGAFVIAKPFTADAFRQVLDPVLGAA